MPVKVPCGRDGSFEPALVRKHKRRVGSFDERIIALYGRGMTVREIQGFFEEAYDARVSPGLISKVTDAVLEDLDAWQRRRDRVYLDGLVVKVRRTGSCGTEPSPSCSG